MAIARETTAANVKPLRGSVVRRHVCGATVAVAELVTLKADGFIDPTDETSGLQTVLGIAVQAGLITETIDVVVFGPIQSITGGAIGSSVYGSDTAGEPSESVGSNTAIAGFNESATVIFVRPSAAL